MDKKKVLLITRPDCGGAERMTVLYGKILEKSGFTIDMLLLQIKKETEHHLAAFIPSHWNVTVAVRRFRYLIFSIYSYLKQTRPDLVFCSSVGFSNMILILKFLHLYKGKVVVRECNMPSRHIKMSNRFSRFFFRYADLLIAQTEEMNSEMKEYYQLKDDRIKVIHNPIDKDYIAQGIKEDVAFVPDSTVFMACGRLQPQKDILTLVKAFDIVHKQISNAVLYLIGKLGNEEYMEKIHSIVKACNLEQCVFFEGFQSNPYKYMKKADVFVLSSVYEGMPNAMLEAMYLGRPVAATCCIPYISQVVEDGKNGYTCPVGDADALAECMVKALALKDLSMYKAVNQSDGVITDVFKGLFSTN